MPPSWTSVSYSSLWPFRSLSFPLEWPYWLDNKSIMLRSDVFIRFSMPYDVLFTTAYFDPFDLLCLRLGNYQWILLNSILLNVDRLCLYVISYPKISSFLRNLHILSFFGTKYSRESGKWSNSLPEPSHDLNCVISITYT